MARSLWKELFQPSIVLHRLSLSSPPLHTRIKSLLNFKPNKGKYSYKNSKFEYTSNLLWGLQPTISEYFQYKYYYSVCLYF